LGLLKKNSLCVIAMNAEKTKSTMCDFTRIRCVPVVVAVVAVFSLPAFSNVALNALQRDMDRLVDGSTFILSRSFEIDGTLLIKNKSNITIDGNNLTITQLKQNTLSIKITDCNNVKVENLALIGDPGSYQPFRETDGVGMYMINCKGQHLIEGVKFYDNGCAGFKAVDVSNIYIKRCLFNAQNVAVKDNEAFNCGVRSYGTHCDNWEVQNCTFEKIAMGLILYKGHDHLSIHDNNFMDMRGQQGMYLNASSHVNIYNNIFTNVYGAAIKLQMNIGHDEIETDIRIKNNTCNVESTKEPGQAGIIVGVAGPNGPAKNVYWTGVCIEGNKVNRFDYGIEIKYTKDVNVANNELSNTTYGILAFPCGGSIRSNTITTTKWTGIYCNLIEESKVSIVGNTIRDAVHIDAGDIYKRCGIFLTGSGLVELENNQMYNDSGQHLYGLYQGSGITFTRYRNNGLLGPVELKGKVGSQADNDNVIK